MDIRDKSEISCYESPLGVTRSFTPGPLQFKAPSKVSETSLYVCQSKVSENISKLDSGCAMLSKVQLQYECSVSFPCKDNRSS